MHHPRLVLAYEGHVATVTFDRPDVHNAFDLSMWGGLRDTMNALSARDELRCVILRGAGTQAFSVGIDIAAMQEERGTPEREAIFARVFDDAMQSIRLCQHPVVALILGNCLGGGAGIASMCDFRVGGEGIRFGVTASRMGLFYPYAEIDPLIRIVGAGVAAGILIEGRILDGREAYEKGILSRVVPDAEVEAEARALAHRIADGSPLAARFHKQAIRRLRGDLPVSDADERAVSAFVETEDFRNACAAFLDKRPPRFEGR
jgi:enoyl-CoA hydratase/carnithine racemase